MSSYLITRADDFGSARAANDAILSILSGSNFIKNVSCMAASPHIDQVAEQLERIRKEKRICIGMHVTLNSEWDYVKFLPLCQPDEIPSLVDDKGMFQLHPMFFSEKMPVVEEAMKEISAQLDYLTRLGLTIEYIDSHMLPDATIPGLKEALSELAQKKGLVDQRWFYTFPPKHQPMLTGEKTLEEDARDYGEWFLSFLEGHQYIDIFHPAYLRRETQLFQNQFLKGDGVAKSRDAERRLLCSGAFGRLCEEHQVLTLKYTEAKPQGDTTEIAAKNF